MSEQSILISTTSAGFRPGAFQPAYGLAENTLLVCAAGLGEAVRLARPDWARTAFGKPVPILETTEFAPVLPGAAQETGPGWPPGHIRA